MKRLLIAAIASVILGCAVMMTGPNMITIHAQTLPVTRTLTWDANDPAEVVTQYNPTMDGTSLGPVKTTSVPITITTAGKHIFTVTASNEWGVSAATTLTINVVVPNGPKGLKINP